LKNWLLLLPVLLILLYYRFFLTSSIIVSALLVAHFKRSLFSSIGDEIKDLELSITIVDFLIQKLNVGNLDVKVFLDNDFYRLKGVNTLKFLKKYIMNGFAPQSSMEFNRFSDMFGNIFRNIVEVTHLDKVHALRCLNELSEILRTYLSFLREQKAISAQFLIRANILFHILSLTLGFICSFYIILGKFQTMFFSTSLDWRDLTLSSVAFLIFNRLLFTYIIGSSPSKRDIFFSLSIYLVSLAFSYLFFSTIGA